MFRINVGERGGPLAAHVPPNVLKKLAKRSRSPRPRSTPPKFQRAAGGDALLERLPRHLSTQLFARDGYNVVRELLALLRTSRTLRDAVGTKPSTMIRDVLPVLRCWRNYVFPRKAPARARVNSWSSSPLKRASRNRPIMFL